MTRFGIVSSDANVTGIGRFGSILSDSIEDFDGTTGRFGALVSSDDLTIPGVSQAQDPPELTELGGGGGTIV